MTARVREKAGVDTSVHRPARVQRSRQRGWRMPINTVYVGRPSLFGNPFRVSEWGQAGAVAAFRVWLKYHPHGHAMTEFAKTMLRGKDLACWCAPGVPCHADCLLEIANA